MSFCILSIWIDGSSLRVKRLRSEKDIIHRFKSSNDMHMHVLGWTTKRIICVGVFSLHNGFTHIYDAQI